MDSLTFYYWRKILDRLSMYDLENMYLSKIGVFKEVVRRYIGKEDRDSLMYYYFTTQRKLGELQNRIENLKINCMDHNRDISNRKKCYLCYSFFCSGCSYECPICNLYFCRSCQDRCVNCNFSLCGECDNNFCQKCEGSLCLSCATNYSDQCRPCYKLGGRRPYKYVYP